MAGKKQQKREVLVLVRYYIKKDYAPKGLHAGDIVLYVENSEGKRYYTTLRRNKAHSCTCNAGLHNKRCYHVDQMVELHNALYATRKAAKVAQQEVKPSVQPVVSLVSEERYSMSETLLAKLAGKPAEPTPLKRDMLDAPLNGNRGFSLLKVS